MKTISEYLEEENIQLDDLAKKLDYSYSYISKLHVGQLKATRKFRRRCIERLGVVLCHLKEKE